MAKPPVCIAKDRGFVDVARLRVFPPGPVKVSVENMVYRDSCDIYSRDCYSLLIGRVGGDVVVLLS